MLRPVAIRVGLVDRPAGRKKHQGNIPLIGGAAMFAGLVLGLALLDLQASIFGSLVTASLLLVLVGMFDDRFDLTASIRISIQSVVILIMIFGAELAIADIGDLFGYGVISTGPLNLAVTLLVALTVMNAYNLIDGADGLAGSLAVITLVAVALVAGQGHLFAGIALTAAAIIAGFLLFNFPGAWNGQRRSFMGDAGSTLLGFTIVWVTLGVCQGSESVISPIHCLWFAALPIIDCLTCVAGRLRKGKSPFVASRDHSHHVLKRGGLDARQVLGILICMQVLYAAIGVFGYFSGAPDLVMLVSWLVVGLSHQGCIQGIAKYHRLYLWNKIRTAQPSGQIEIART